MLVWMMPLLEEINDMKFCEIVRRKCVQERVEGKEKEN